MKDVDRPVTRIPMVPDKSARKGLYFLKKTAKKTKDPVCLAGKEQQ